MKQVTTQEIAEIYNVLAKEYGEKKRESMLNLLFCGRLLYNAKKNLPHGMFANFLADTRVAESERTAQRLMAIYRNFGHLLVGPGLKLGALDKLGVSHLLELQKLPARFRKQAALELEIYGEKVIEDAEVIDEEKLTAFLDKTVKFNGSNTPIRDLPVDEMKRYIEEASGIHTPSKQVTDQQMVESTDSYDESDDDFVEEELGMRIKGAVLPEDQNGIVDDDSVEFNSLEDTTSSSGLLVESLVNKFRTKLSDFTMDINDLNSQHEQIRNHPEFENMDGGVRTGFKKDVTNVRQRMEGLMVRLMELEDRL